jgi:hypothetical protein
MDALSKPAARRTRRDVILDYADVKAAIAALTDMGDVKDVHDKSAAMQDYARRARDPDLIDKAVEVRQRSGRRLGELMAAARAAGKLAKGGVPHHKATGVSATPVASLDDQGIDKNLAKIARKLAAMSAEKFETALQNWRDRAIAVVEHDRTIRGTGGTGDNEWFASSWKQCG